MRVIPFDRDHRLGFGPQMAVVVLVVGLAGAMAIEPTRQLLEQRSRIDGMTTDLQEIEHSNKALSRRIEKLKDPAYLEQQAREQGGFLMPGETRVVVLPPEEDGHVKPKRKAPPAPDPGFLESLIDFISPG